MPRSDTQGGRVLIPPANVDHDRIFGAFAVVIDDDAENRFSMKELLIQWGCHVVDADSPKRAIEALTGHLRVPDLIVSDLALRARESGFDAVKQIRELTGDPIPAIIVTGDLTQKPGEHDLASSIWIIHKPVNPIRFRHLVERILVVTAEAIQ
jgi:CheY-like chemotaxis protein